MPNKRKIEKEVHETDVSNAKIKPERNYPINMDFHIKKVFKKKFKGSPVDAGIKRETLRYLSEFCKSVVDDIVSYCEKVKNPHIKRISCGLLKGYITTKLPSLEKVFSAKFKKMNEKMNENDNFNPKMEDMQRPINKAFFKKSVKGKKAIVADDTMDCTE